MQQIDTDANGYNDGIDDKYDTTNSAVDSSDNADSPLRS